MQLSYDLFAALVDAGYAVSSRRIQPVEFDHVAPSKPNMTQLVPYIGYDLIKKFVAILVEFLNEKVHFLATHRFTLDAYRNGSFIWKIQRRL